MTEQTPQSETEIDETVIEVAKKTMVGDMRDVCLQIMKDKKLTGKAWKDMSEGEQKDVVGIITDRVTDAVVQAVQVIAANGQRQIIGTLEQVTNKDGMKSVIKTSAHDELRHDLNDNVGSLVAIVLSGADEFVGVGDKPKIDKDQPELPVEEAADETPTEEGETANETVETVDAETGEITEEGGDVETGGLEEQANQYT